MELYTSIILPSLLSCICFFISSAHKLFLDEKFLLFQDICYILLNYVFFALAAILVLCWACLFIFLLGSIVLHLNLVFFLFFGSILHQHLIFILGCSAPAFFLLRGCLILLGTWLVFIFFISSTHKLFLDEKFLLFGDIYCILLNFVFFAIGACSGKNLVEMHKRKIYKPHYILWT